MIAKKKIGIYGGTFSPPHIGHVRAAEHFASHLSLDELIIMPDFLPPHKQIDGEVETFDRLQMCRLAFSHIDKVNISDFEINRGGKSYTVLTLEAFCAEDRELYFLCGTDMFLTLEGWYSFEKIFKLATVCYVRRENDSQIERKIEELTNRYESKYDARIIPIPVSVTEISSSKLRQLLKLGDNAKSYLTDSVYKYIQEKGLYS